jgi:putative membrane protein
MSEPQRSDAPFGARVIEVDAPEQALRPHGLEVVAKVIETERTDPIRPSEPAPLPALMPAPPRSRDRVVAFGLAGVAVFFVGWLVVDAVGWVSAAFERGATLGTLAAIAVTAGVAGAGAVIARELGSLFRLKNVEAIHRRLADGRVSPGEARKAVADVLAVVPRERATVGAIEAFQRQVQLHHSPEQQVELLSRTVMRPLDRAAEAHVRTAVLRAFGITAISPTALTDAAFFLACGIRMVRGVATSYGHRPTAATTAHLLRRLVLEAGKLGAVDIASASLVQHLGGAVTERVASSAAEALYAAYRMARLGIIVMDLCRPIAFREDEVPSVSSLVGNVLKRRTEQGAIAQPTATSE